MTDPVTGTDRRGSPQLRTLFVEAYDVLQPFFDPANNWGGQSHEHLAYRALHEQFPGLSAQDVYPGHGGTAGIQQRRQTGGALSERRTKPAAQVRFGLAQDRSRRS